MQALILMVLCMGAYLIAYHSYGKFLSQKIFKIRPDAPVPSTELGDGIDYVPSKKWMLFGHHFTSIAGTGPIVGPAIGLIWGWLPAILWVVFGCIFMGAVHDFGALVVSMRNEGKSISETAAKYINPRVRFIFFAIVFFALLIIIAIFGLVIATVFKIYPESVIAVWLEIPIAIALGWAVYKKGAPVPVATVVAVVAMYLAVGLGAYLEHLYPGLFSIPDTSFMPATGIWTIILLVYAWIASTLPVTTLLQPRDYINAWQLMIMMALLALGVVAASVFGHHLNLVAPAINAPPPGRPALFPMMFVTIACGAVSGFHSLVASGTSPKQISTEADSQFVGYGSMLLEGALAVLIIICIAAGIGMNKTPEIGRQIWEQSYSQWLGSKGLPDKLTPVVTGAANIMTSLKIPAGLGIAIMGVFISSFAGTTLDSAVRIQRYVISELAEDLKFPAFSKRHTATAIAVITAAGLAFAKGTEGKGAVVLWPLFGSVNQLLAALALLVVTMYLKRKGGFKYFIAGIPCIILMGITAWAMILNQRSFFARQDWLLVSLGMIIFVLAIWMIIETVRIFITAGPGHQRESA